MNFSFGIITDSSDGAIERIAKIEQSILNLNIPNFEIIIIGNKTILNDNFKNLNIIDFNDNEKPKWITKKKNLITQNAKYENIVYQHDYIKYDIDWYEGFKKFGNDFDVCMNKIKNLDGTRFRDWVIFPWHHCTKGKLASEAAEIWKHCNITNNASMIPYNETNFTKWQYISGSYWVAKKHVMQEFPLDEKLLWGQGEDVNFSMRFKPKYRLQMNQYSTVHFLKQKQDAFIPITNDSLKELRKIRAWLK